MLVLRRVRVGNVHPEQPSGRVSHASATAELAVEITATQRPHGRTERARLGCIEAGTAWEAEPKETLQVNLSSQTIGG